MSEAQQPDQPDQPDQTQQHGQHLEDANKKLKNLIPPLKELTASLEIYAAAQEESGKAASGSAPDAAAQTADRLAKLEAERLEAERLAEAERLKAKEAEEKLKKAEEEKLKAEKLKAQGDQEAAQAEAVPAFKQSNSNIKFTGFEGKVDTTYDQIMNRKIDKFFKQIDAQIKNADTTEDQEMLRARKVKYESVKKLLEAATTEAEVNKIINDNKVKFDSNSITSGGTRKPRMHRRKKTQRKRSKTIKKKNRAGKRK